MKYLKKSFAVLLIAAVLLGSASGCKKSGNESTGSDEYEWVTDVSEIVVSKDGNAANSGTQGNNSGNGNTASGKPNGNTASGSIANQNLKDKYKNLKGRKITVVGWWDATSPSSEEGKLIAEVEKLFNCDMIEKKLTDYKPLYTSILSGTPICDLFVPRDTHVLNLANKNMLTALDTLSTFNKNDSIWNRSVIQETSFRGHVYGMTAGVSYRDMLFYNKDMFKQNGWEDLYTLYQQGGLTWDKLYSIMEKAAQSDAGGNVTRYGMLPKYDPASLGMQLMRMNGVKIVSRQGDTANLKNTLNSTAATNALNTLKKWYSKKGLTYDCTAFGWASATTLFRDGKGAMILLDNANDLKDVSFTLGAVPFPKGNDTNTQYFSYEATNATVMPAGVKNPEDVMLFWSVREAYNQQNRKQTIFDTLSDPSVKGTYDIYKNGLWNGKQIYDFAEALDLDLGNHLNKIAAGSETANETIQSVQRIVDGKIKDFWK